MRVTLNRVFDGTVSLIRDCAKASLYPSFLSHITVALSRALNPTMSISREEGMKVFMEREYVGACILTYMYDVIVEPPYLEITPEVIWVYPSFRVFNEVFSNVSWTIE